MGDTSRLHWPAARGTQGELLATGIVHEGEIRKDDLLQAADLFLINSVRGWMRLQRDHCADAWRIATGACAWAISA